MVLRMRVLIVVVASIWAFAGVSPSAYALGKHQTNPTRAQRKAKKKTSPYAYLAPKKQKKPSSCYYNSLTGERVCGKKK